MSVLPQCTTAFSQKGMGVSLGEELLNGLSKISSFFGNFSTIFDFLNKLFVFGFFYWLTIRGELINFFASADEIRVN